MKTELIFFVIQWKSMSNEGGMVGLGMDFDGAWKDCLHNFFFRGVAQMLFPL